MSGIYDHIPGLRETEEAYAASSIEAFLGIEPKLAGKIEVVPFTSFIFLELDYAKNRFFSSQEEPAEEDVAAFLWRISPAFQRSTEARRSFALAFQLVLIEVPLPVVTAELYAYCDRALSSVPMATRARGGPVEFASWPSVIVDLLASNYGWSEEAILNLPFRRLWQYVHRIRETKNPKYREQCEKALSLRQRWLIEQNTK